MAAYCGKRRGRGTEPEECVEIEAFGDESWEEIELREVELPKGDVSGICEWLALLD